MSYEDFLGRSSLLSQQPRRSSSTTPNESPTTSHVPESHSEAPRPVITVAELVQQPGRDFHIILDLKRRHPKSTWFGYSNNGISKSILKMLHSILDKRYTKYSDIPSEEQAMWFRTFAQEFTWDHNITKMVEREFHKEAGVQFSRNMSQWKQHWRKGKSKPKGLNEGVWLHFIPHWEDPATEALSKINSANRRSHRGGKGMYVHNGGSTSIISRADELMHTSDGVPPNHLDVIESYHTNTKTGEVQDGIISEMVVKVKKMKVDLLSQSDSSSPDLTRDEINQLVLEEIPIRKGRRRGLGRIGDIDSATYSPGFHYNEEIIRMNEELKEKVSILEAAKADTEERFANAQVELAKTQGELVSTQGELTTTKTTVQSMADFMKSKFPDCPHFQ